MKCELKRCVCSTSWHTIENVHILMTDMIDAGRTITCNIDRNRSTYVDDDAADIHYISSQRGRTMLVHRGYHYVHEKRIRSKVYWRCTQYTTRRKCHGRLHMENGRIVRKSFHNHNTAILMERRKRYHIEYQAHLLTRECKSKPELN